MSQPAPAAERDDLRVIAFVSAFPRTSETFVLRQARRLPALVCTLERTDEVVDLRGVQILTLPPSPTDLGGSVARVRRLVRRATGRPSRAFSPAAARAWHRTLKVLRPDVVLVHFGGSAPLVAPGCHALGVPYVVHFHGIDLSQRLAIPAYRADLARVAETAAGFVVVSRDQRRRLREVVGDVPRVDLIPYGVPLAEFKPTPRPESDVCRFLAVGRLVSKKAPDVTVRAFASVRAACPTARLDVVGGGPLEDSVRSLVAELGLENCVALHGALPNERVRALLGESSVFVQHSRRSERGDEEGWPVAIAEAAASGLPVVATQHAGIPDQVVDGETGYLVEEGDEPAMAACMRRLALSPELRDRMGRGGRAHMERCGDLERQVASLRESLRAAARGAQERKGRRRAAVGGRHG